MPLSTPMKIITLRFDPEEKARLAELAREQNVTLSHALREGAKLYLQDLQEASASRRHDLA
jgi:predicted transcriptional regulator